MFSLQLFDKHKHVDQRIKLFENELGYMFEKYHFSSV